MLHNAIAHIEHNNTKQALYDNTTNAVDEFGVRDFVVECRLNIMILLFVGLRCTMDCRS
jgi:hypothetical protein